MKGKSRHKHKGSSLRIFSVYYFLLRFYYPEPPSSAGRNSWNSISYVPIFMDPSWDSSLTEVSLRLTFLAKKCNSARLIGNPLFIIMKKRCNTSGIGLVIFCNENPAATTRFCINWIIKRQYENIMVYRAHSNAKFPRKLPWRYMSFDGVLRDRKSVV